MDHRISKDMISSGMIPSGEKNQEDLGKTQYGTVPSPNALADVYKKMYETKEEVINEHHKKDADGNTIPHEDEEIKEGKMPAGLQAYLDKKKGKKEDKKDVKEDNIDEALPLIVAKGAAMLGKIGAIAGKTAVKTGVKLGGKTGGAIAKSIVRNPGAALNKAANVSYGMRSVGSMIPKPSMPAVEKQKSSGGMVSAGADLFDIVKGQLLDEGLSEEEIRDIMLTLTPDEILKEIEESSMSAGEGADRHMGTDDVARTKQQIGNMFNKNVPKKENTGNKVDKVTRRSINTSARDLGIQGPTTLKQSVEPEGETI